MERRSMRNGQTEVISRKFAFWNEISCFSAGNWELLDLDSNLIGRGFIWISFHVCFVFYEVLLEKL